MSTDHDRDLEKEEAIRKDLECPLCLKILLDPLTTPCGHNFCRYCLHRCLEAKQECPICRRSVYMDAQDHPVNTLLRNLVMQTFGDEMEERVTDLKEELKLGVELEIPIFLSSEVAFPDATARLHLYEKRYRWMAKYCLQNNSGFGFVRAQHEDIEKLRLLTTAGAQIFSSAAMVMHGVGEVDEHDRGSNGGGQRRGGGEREERRRGDDGDHARNGRSSSSATSTDVPFEVHDESGEVVRMRRGEGGEIREEVVRSGSSSPDRAASPFPSPSNRTATSGEQSPLDGMSDEEEEEFTRGLQFLTGRVGCLISISRAYMFPDGRCFAETVGVKRFEILGTRVQPESNGLLFARVRCLNEVDFIRACSAGLSLTHTQSGRGTSEREGEKGDGGEGKEGGVETRQDEAQLPPSSPLLRASFGDACRKEEEQIDGGMQVDGGRVQVVERDEKGPGRRHGRIEQTWVEGDKDTDVHRLDTVDEDNELKSLFAYLMMEVKKAMDGFPSYADKLRNGSEGGDPLSPYLHKGSGRDVGFKKRARKFSYFLSHVLPISNADKQRLLECNTTVERFRLLKEYTETGRVVWDEKRWQTFTTALFGQGSMLEGSAWLVRTFLLYAAICVILWDSLGASSAIPFTILSLLLVAVATRFRTTLRSLLFPNDDATRNANRAPARFQS